MRFWKTKYWQACKIGECVDHGEPFPDDVSIGELHEMPVYIPSVEELATVGKKAPDVSMDSANSKVAIAVFRKRAVAQRNVLFSEKIVWERLA